MLLILCDTNFKNQNLYRYILCWSSKSFTNFQKKYHFFDKKVLKKT